MNEINSDTMQTDELTKRHLLSDESYAILSNAQRKIKEATEMTPTLRKLVNELVTTDSVESLTQKYIQKLSE
jgi:hypothetical protein